MKILVTLDGSHFSEAILETVARIARPLNADVELLAIAQPDQAHGTLPNTTYAGMAPLATSSGTALRVPLPADVAAPAAETRTQAIARMESSLQDYLALRARELPGISIDTRVEFAADAGEAIVERARQTHPDLIAMATHGRTGIGHLLAGSVCERVIRSGVAPVLVLRP